MSAVGWLASGIPQSCPSRMPASGLPLGTWYWQWERNSGQLTLVFLPLLWLESCNVVFCSLGLPSVERNVWGWGETFRVSVLFWLAPGWCGLGTLVFNHSLVRQSPDPSKLIHPACLHWGLFGVGRGVPTDTWVFSQTGAALQEGLIDCMLQRHQVGFWN